MRFLLRALLPILMCCYLVAESSTAMGAPAPPPLAPKSAVTIQHAGAATAMTSSGALLAQAGMPAGDITGSGVVKPPPKPVSAPASEKATGPRVAVKPATTSNCQKAPAAGPLLYTACVATTELPAELPPVQAAKTGPRAGHVSPNGVVVGEQVPFPSGCSTSTTPDRNTTCRHYLELWRVNNVQTGELTGTQNMELWEYWQTNPTTLVIQHGIWVETREATGVYSTGATISLVNPCVGGLALNYGAACSATQAYNAPDPSYVMPNTLMGNFWVESYSLGTKSRIASDTVPGASLYIEVSPTSPPAPVTTFVSYLIADEAWRCDNQVRGTGCVDPLFVPTIVFNTRLNPLVRPVAIHMRDAQNQLPQHWGQPGSGQPIHRLTTGSQSDANGRAACASFVPDPPVAITCDEYPFATSYEGGAGASIRAVPKSANDSQGGLLIAGYNSSRILDSDAYYVQIIIDDSANEKVMVVGDSISQGLEGDYTWRYRLWQHFQSDGVNDAFVGPRTGTHDLYSGGEDGGTYRVAGWEDAHDALWGREALQEKDVIQGITSTYQADVIIIELGFNDLAWVDSPTGTRNSIATLITNARNANPDAKFVLGNVPDRIPLANRPDLTGLINSYNALLPALVSSMSTAQSPIALTDLHSAYTAATDSRDGIHPNGVGEYKIAAAFANTLASAYGIGQSFGSIPSSVPDLTMATPTLTVSPNDGGALLYWTHSYGADGYWIYIENVSNGETTFTELPLAVGTDHWQSGGLTDGQVVKYAVQARRSDTNVSDLSNAVQVTVHPKTPPPPTGTASTGCSGCTSVSVSWSPVSAATGYNLYWVDETQASTTLLVVSVTGTSYNLPTTSGHQYNLAVSSINQYGEGPPTAAPAIVGGYGAPAATHITAATQTSSSTATIQWAAVPGATGYYVWTRNWATGGAFTQLPYALDTLSFDSVWMFDGPTNHEFEIQAINGSMNGPLSAPVRVS